MPINFDNPPKSTAGFAVTAPGFYKAKIERKKMQQSKTPGKKPYLNVTLALSDDTGAKGKFFDPFFDSEAEICQTKVIRFCKAIGLVLSGQLGLPDIAKIIPEGKELCVEIINEPDKVDTNKVWAKVRVFGSESYWPIAAWSDLKAVGGAASSEPSPFDFGSDEEDTITEEDTKY